MSNMSIFAAVFDAKPVTNNVRPARCMEMLFAETLGLIAIKESPQLSVLQSLGGVRTDFGYGVLTSDAG